MRFTVSYVCVCVCFKQPYGSRDKEAMRNAAQVFVFVFSLGLVVFCEVLLLICSLERSHALQES